MNPTPAGWPRITPALFYADPKRAIEWLCRTFDFEARLIVEGEGGSVEHSELQLGDDGLIMVSGVGTGGDRQGQEWRQRLAHPGMVGGKLTQDLAVHVDDVDAHCKKARACGATIVYEPATSDYGDDYWADRNYAALDCEGHLWWFMQRLRTGGKHGG